MHTPSGGGRKRARIEIIPLIDIIFFLLATFIMVSLSMTKNQGVAVALPTAATSQKLSEQQDQDKTLTLSVQAFKTSNKDPKVIINSDGSADFKHVVAVLDEVRKTGIGKVGINTSKK